MDGAETTPDDAAAWQPTPPGAPPEYDFWVFDLDGTLVDVPHSYAREVFDDVGDRLDCAFSDREVTTLWHGLRGSRNDTLRTKGLDPERFWTAFHEVESPRDRAEVAYLHDDAAFVADLDVPVGIVTHSQEYLAKPVLDAVGIRDWFDAVVCCNEELGWKPDPAPVHRALSQMGVAEVAGADAAADGGTGRGVLVGDGPSDVGAAWNAGLDAVHVERHSPVVRGQCVRADYRVTDIDDLYCD